MEFLITFLEGLISFISPCMLPMLPIYVSYFAAGGKSKGKMLPRVLAFVFGFTVVFAALGLFAGTLGAFLSRYRTALEIICGCIVVCFGLSYLEIIRLPFFRGMKSGVTVRSVWSALVFGMIYSVSLTPCVGAFLGSALMMASTAGTALRGTMLLCVYSLGLGVPFVLAALLIDRLTVTFGFIKRHYRVINLVCGIFLIVVGVFMACGGLGFVLNLFS